MNTAVSFIIPAHNSATTLVEALDSVAAQSHPVLEILVVDDVSRDDTAAIADRWSEQHHGLARVIRQSRNTGPAGARNTGIRAASGNWIAFLDADDACLPGRIEAQLNTAATHPDAVLLCGETLPLAPGTAAPSTAPAFRIKTLHLEDFVCHNPIATSTVMARRDIIESIGYFDEQFRGPEDYDLWLRIASHHECLLMETPLSRYRTTVGSLSMDDRTFLPQVLAVLGKAFSPGGALHAHRNVRRQAYAEQYASASWMAHNRGARTTALRWLFRSWACGFVRLHKEHEDSLQRVKLLLRYLRP